MMRFEAYRLAGWQLLVTAIIAALMWLAGGTNWATSALAGGFIGGGVLLPMVAAFATAVGTKRAYDNWLDR